MAFSLNVSNDCKTDSESIRESLSPFDYLRYVCVEMFFSQNCLENKYYSDPTLMAYNSSPNDFYFDLNFKTKTFLFLPLIHELLDYFFVSISQLKAVRQT